MKLTIGTVVAKVSMALGAVCLLAIGMYAQDNRSRAKIPFDFLVSGKTMKAGVYDFGTTSYANVAHLRNAKTGMSIFVAVSVPTPNAYAERRCIVFHQYGSETFLSEVSSGPGLSLRVPVSKREKELMLGPKTASMSVVSVAVRAD